MFEKIKEITNKKIFHLIMLIIIITIILFLAGVIILKYNVEGETNMPFKINKISIISSSEGIDKEATDTKWAFDLYQSNDVYIYIDKNKNYSKSELIKSINIENINIDANNKENIKIYKPSSQAENLIFKNSDENIVESIEYVGDVETNLTNLKISNQGGIIAFRCSNNNLAEYKSDDEIINHQELLKKCGIINDDLKFKIYFDLIINLESGKEYKTTINLDLPVDNVVESGTTSIEITNLTDFIFKRINN